MKEGHPKRGSCITYGNMVYFLSEARERVKLLEVEALIGRGFRLLLDMVRRMSEGCVRLNPVKFERARQGKLRLTGTAFTECQRVM